MEHADHAEQRRPGRTGVDARDWPAVEALFDQLIEQPEARWHDLLGDSLQPEAVRQEVLSLLRASLDSGPPEAAADAMDEADSGYRLRSGDRLAGWRIEAPIGRGGMGEVYRASREFEGAHQLAALKLLTALHGPDARQRFAQERILLVRLRHPGIAHFLDAGEHLGLPWMAMELIDGEPLDRAARTLPIGGRIDMFMQVCAAVAHAHLHLVLHRDLKPSNVLVDQQGRIHLLDFGIAKLLDDAPSEHTVAPRLSPEYAAPEQLRGEPLSTAADTFALGVLLHELLTGQPLFAAGGASTLQRLAGRLAGEPILAPSARLVGSDAACVRGDLDAITMKALRPEPEARYANAQSLLDDLRAWRGGEPVAARRDERGYRSRHLLHRYRWWIGAALTLILVLGSASAAIAWQAHQAALERDLARRETERADALRQYLMLTFRDAGAHEGGSPTAKQVLDGAAARIDRELAGDPTRFAGVALALADLYFHLSDYAGAEPLLLRLLAAPGIDPAQRAMAEHDLGQVAYRQDKLAAARQHLASAQTFWASDAQRYRSELLGSRLLESQLLRARGNREAALSVLQAALAERLEVSGKIHRETGILINNLGIAEAELGRLDAAVDWFTQAAQVWQALGLERSPDALNTLNNWASSEQRRQRSEVAIPLFENALALRRELYGASAAMAALQSNLGKTLLQAGRAREALVLFREALPMAAQYAGENSLLALSAGLGEADAHSALGEPAIARARLDALAPRIDAAFPPPHPLALLRWVSEARWAEAAGQPERRKAALLKARRLAEALGPAGRPYLAAIDALQPAAR